MKVSLQWMNELSGGNLPLGEKDIVERIGAQLGAVEEVIDLTPIYEAAVAVKVVKAEPLEGSDHLNVCLVDDLGVVKDVERQDGLVQVVCGAPNVRDGLKAVWLPPGSTVPVSYGKDPFVLSARKIMGTVSNGMLASAKELAIGEDHEGIVELPDETEAGSRLVDLLHLDDQVIDIENKMFTHRPDLFGQLGVARELCAIYGKPFKSPEWYREDRKVEGDGKLSIKLDNRLHDDGCPRFVAVAISGLKVGPSPLWLQSYLARTGIRPINNIVDVTNYVMMVTGQPLHAYDLEKLEGGDDVELIVRKPESGEGLKLLDGSSVALNKDDIVIADRNKVLGLGGIMGGQDSEVSRNTSSIILECASFDMYTIRRSAMAHGVFSEAVTRFTKGQSPRQCQTVLAYAWDLLHSLSPEAEIVSEVADAGAKLDPPEPVTVDLKLLDSYLGMEMPADEALKLLNDVGLDAAVQGSDLLVRPPFWRTDISSGEDIIEEVARLKGFDKLPMRLPKRTLAPSFVPVEVTLKDRIREVLSSGGANELLSYSFVDEKLMKQSAQPLDRAFRLANALSPELQYYRTSLTPSLLKAVHPNHKSGYGRLALFELGMVHFSDVVDEEGLPLEPKRLSLVVSADTKASKAHYEGPAYYQARAFLEYLLQGLDISLEGIRFAALSELANLDTWGPAAGFFYDGRSACIKVGNDVIGVIGEYGASLSRALKLPEYSAGFEIDLTALASLYLERRSPYKQLSRFPSVWQDLTVVRPADMPYQQLLDELNAKLASVLKDDIVAELNLIDIYQGEAADTRNWTFRLKADSHVRTLTDQEVAAIVEELKLDAKS